jgi:predicted GIY-YIG superfamily endonuclease
MSININGYSFEGPYPLATTSFNEVAGIYLISDVDKNYIDVGETDKLQTRMSSHERKDCWKRNAARLVNVWFHHDTNKNSRLLKEKRIRDSHPFRCGLA